MAKPTQRLPETRIRLFRLPTSQPQANQAACPSAPSVGKQANQFAADLLFQGKLFNEQCLSLDTSLKPVIELAPHYSASYEAAFRRYAESHVLPCAQRITEMRLHT